MIKTLTFCRETHFKVGCSYTYTGKLCNLAAALNMEISSTKFKHKRIHKETWRRPGATEGNEINHILISKNTANTVNDMRSYRGANADSDHFVVIAKIKKIMYNSIKKNKIQVKR
ncbi:hypothetical protein RI129_010732 [Pyrocoelia pectoralis]|uniref:Endonuclease/exonuclease/phosphatase domain-containing protein n=1 Tax=Pyrocoelia pectoralis TaxID=417401 RepID=A0AAN7ZGR4_9COLE